MSVVIILKNKKAVSYAETATTRIIRIQKENDEHYSSYSGPLDAATTAQGTLEEILSGIPKGTASKLKELFSIPEVTDERIMALGFDTCSVM